MRTMTEKELRAFDPKEIEHVDIDWDNGTDSVPYKATGRVLFDYDQGLSILNKENSEDCLTGAHGPAYKGDSNYTTKEEYNEWLTSALNMLKKSYYKGEIALGGDYYGSATCSFT